MGKSGPRPKPTNLKLLHGETRPSRLNLSEPQPPSDNAARCPSQLSDDAKKVWRRLAPQLHSKGLLTEWDRETFMVFCEAVVAHRRAVDLMGTSLLIKGLHGGLVKNPAAQIVRDQASIIRGFAQEFGLTPSARTGIRLDADDGDGELARLLS